MNTTNGWGNRPDEPEWTEDQDALLAKLWNDGWSFRRIGEHPEIKKSRPAVSGRRHRLKKTFPWMFTRIVVKAPKKQPERAPTFVVPPMLVEHHAAGLCATEGCAKTRLKPYDLCQEHLAERRRPRRLALSPFMEELL